MESRDPSVKAAGIHSNITGSRADLIICDDVEVPNTCNTADKRALLRERLGENEFILVPGGTELYIGTPHTYFTIYTDKARAEIGEDQPFLGECRRLCIPVLTAEGKSAWPERYPLEEIRRMRRESGPRKFAAQMMLEPKNMTEGRLDPSLLRRYDAALEYSEAQQRIQLRLNGKRLVSCSAWWDPAFGKTSDKASGDNSVLAVVYTDEDGAYWLHRTQYISISEKEDEDEATQQCRRVTESVKELYVPSVAIETNGIGKFLPAMLRQELAKAGVPCAVVERTSTKPKAIRILEAFDAVMAAQALHVHASVYDTPFITEMQEWQPGGSKGHDDGLDAVAGALSLEPVRLKRSYAFSPGRTGWQGASESHRAQTDFDV